MNRFLSKIMKNAVLSGQKKTLEQWQENSFTLVLTAICIIALPALVNSTIRAAGDKLWINIFVYCIAYLICIVITFFRSIPFKIRAYTGVCIFLGLSLISIFSTGPLGSGRIWLYTTAVFTTLILGIRPGIFILLGQALILSVFYYYLKSNPDFTSKLAVQSAQIWITTSITLMFLSIISVVAMGRLIKGIAVSLDESQKTSALHEETTRQLAQRVEDHNNTILSLKESEERWHFALEGAGDGVVDWSLNNDHVFYSSRWKKMLGYDNEDIGVTIDEWFNRVHPDDRNKFYQEIHQPIQENAPFFQSRHRLMCKDGSYKWIFARGKVIQWSDNGTPSRVIGTHADITAFKQLENQQREYEIRLQQSQKMEAIGTLAGGIAHDFNNILFPILGHTEMMLEETTENTAAHESLKQIHASALRAKELVRQILAFSRQEATDYQPIKIQLILKEVVKLLRATLPRNIEIRQCVDSKCRSVDADATQIHQVIMNLATNAYHAIGDTQGQLMFYLNEGYVSPKDSTHLGIEPGDVVCLTVADTGTGMPPEMVTKIFDPFFTTKKKGQGTGMGLSVVHGIIKIMKGAITVSSEPGKGTKFKVYFPISEKLINRKNSDYLSSNPHFSGTERILIVDDEKAILEVASRALERIGYHVTPMNNPVDALAAFRDAPNKFDLIVTDMSMPKMSGKALALELLAIRSDIPIILCTGFSEEITPEMVTEMGLKEVVMKPVMLKELCGKIRKTLGESDKMESCSLEGES